MTITTRHLSSGYYSILVNCKCFVNNHIYHHHTRSRATVLVTLQVIDVYVA